MGESLLTVIVVAFIAQLAVLPGEKVQFIIAALSTRYRPLTVVGAAGSAFAGWTVLEILFGGALQSAVPGIYLDALTAGLFTLFAVLLVRSAPERGESLLQSDSLPEAVPETDQWSVLTRPLPNAVDGGMPDRLRTFGAIFAMMAAGEFGDKTQIVTITLAARYGAHPGIWAGEMLAIIPISLANAYVFHRYARRVSRRLAHFGAALLFLIFALDTVLAAVVGASMWEAAIWWATELANGM